MIAEVHFLAYNGSVMKSTDIRDFIHKIGRIGLQIFDLERHSNLPTLVLTSDPTKSVFPYKKLENSEWARKKVPSKLYMVVFPESTRAMDIADGRVQPIDTLICE